MRVEFFGDYREKARVTKGWLKKVTYVAVRDRHSKNRYPPFGEPWTEYDFVYEGTDIRCSDSKGISHALARLERSERRAMEREHAAADRSRARAMADAERDHVRSLQLPTARLLTTSKK